MLLTITYILAAAFGSIPFTWYFVLMLASADFVTVHSIVDARWGTSDEALSADDLEGSE